MRYFQEVEIPCTGSALREGVQDKIPQAHP